jgi:subtilase family serine protease
MGEGMRIDPRSRSRSVFTLLACLTVLVGVLASPAAGRSPSSPGALRLLHGASQAVCPGPASTGHALCASRVIPDASSSPVGLTPAQMKAAYGFTTSATAGAGQTIAIVDAYNLPTAESDLNTFSSQFGLPACTTANGCFTKVNQTGGTKYPRYNSGWGLEIALDIEWAHAIAPGAKILLVEARSNSFGNLLAAEDYAKAHAQYVSNSWGASEFSSETSYDGHFSQPGVSFFVSAGDAGLPADYPSASRNVISVGGTTLHFAADGTLTDETGWSGGGGGCSVYENATAAQSSFSEYAQVNCGGRRATPDLSLDADPSSGAAVYDGSRYQGATGWYQVGGTSLSSPMVAGRAAVSGAVVSSAYVYGNNITFRDITVGNNGAPCLVGFDLCSGRGSWTA